MKFTKQIMDVSLILLPWVVITIVDVDLARWTFVPCWADTTEGTPSVQTSPTMITGGGVTTGTLPCGEGRTEVRSNVSNGLLFLFFFLNFFF